MCEKLTVFFYGKQLAELLSGINLMQDQLTAAGAALAGEVAADG